MSNRRYPGVKPFEADERDRFFGRDRDIRDLYGMIRLEKLVVLYGKSGFGKSSLLNAGILPRFREEKRESGFHYQPLIVRFGTYDAGKRPPVEEVAMRLDEAAPLTESSVFIDHFFPDTAFQRPLWRHFKRRQNSIRTTAADAENALAGNTAASAAFILVFDQFEEFFSYPLAQQERFAEELSELLYTDIPQAVFEQFDRLTTGQQEFLSQPLALKTVFAIRSDRLHLLDQMKDRLPAILHKRYEIKVLSREQARDAIVKPARLEGDFLSQPFEYLPDTLSIILERLSTAAHGMAEGKVAAQTGIEAFQLQVLCQYFEDKVFDGSIRDHSGDNIPDVRPEDLPDLSTIYETYYKRRLEELPEKDRLPARLIVENGLLFVDKQTGDARRLSVDGQALAAQFEHRGASRHLLESLEKTYLIRREVGSTGSFNYEISHDTLIAPVLNAKREREALEARDEAARQAEAERREAERRTREAEAKATEEAGRRAEAEKLQRAAEAGRRRANIFTVIALVVLAFAAYAAWNAEQNLQKFLAAQRKTDRIEIEKLRDRADDLLETGYLLSAKVLYLRADSVAGRHDDPDMRALSDSLRMQIKQIK